MPERARALVPPGRKAPGKDEILAALGRMCDHVEGRIPAIAAAVVEASRVEIPEYEAREDAAAERQRERVTMGLGLLTSLVRTGEGSLPPAVKAMLIAAGEQLAREPEPLNSVIRTYQLAARELINESLEFAPTLGEIAAPALSAGLRIGFSFLAQLIELIGEGFANQESRDGRIAGAAVHVFVSDLVLGIDPERFPIRAGPSGLAPSRSYRAIAFPLPSDGCPGLPDALPPGSVFGRVGTLGIVVSGARPDVSTVSAAIEGAAGRKITIVVGPAREGLTGVRESFEEAVTILESAVAAGTAGAISAIAGAIPRMVAAARSSGIDVTGILRPLLALPARERDELLAALRGYLAHGSSLKAAADALHMHRNTMRRRLDRLEELLGLDVDARWAELEVALVALSAPDRRRSLSG